MSPGTSVSPFGWLLSRCQVERLSRTQVVASWRKSPWAERARGTGDLLRRFPCTFVPQLLRWHSCLQIASLSCILPGQDVDGRPADQKRNASPALRPWAQKSSVDETKDRIPGTDEVAAIHLGEVQGVIDVAPGTNHVADIQEGVTEGGSNDRGEVIAEIQVPLRRDGELLRPENAGVGGLGKEAKIRRGRRSCRGVVTKLPPLRLASWKIWPRATLPVALTDRLPRRY